MRALGIKLDEFSAQGTEKIKQKKILIRRFLYCQNKMCGIRNTTILAKYCSVMCADRDAGIITEKEWVEMHYKFWLNSTIPYEMLGV